MSTISLGSGRDPKIEIKGLACTAQPLFLLLTFPRESDWVSWTYGRGVKWVGDARNRISNVFLLLLRWVWLL